MNTEYKTTISVDLGFETDPDRPITSFSRHLAHAKCDEVHAHPRAQLLLASDGIMKVVVEKQLWIVTPAQGIWIPGNCPHQVFFPENVQVATLFIDPSCSRSLPSDTFAFELSLLLKCLVQKMVSFGNPSPGSPEQLRLAGVLLDELALVTPSLTFLPTSNDPRIKQVTDQIIHNPAANPSLEDSAGLVCVSPRTLSRLFSKHLGTGYGEWKTRSKMVEALKLLEEGAPIKIIAYQLGYENASSFIYAFRKHFGKSPGNYYQK